MNVNVKDVITSGKQEVLKNLLYAQNVKHLIGIANPRKNKELFK